MARFLVAIGAAGLIGAVVSGIMDSRKQTPPAKTETLTCVRVKQVTPAGTINYLCEVRK